MEENKIILNYPIFDRNNIIENASVVIEDGIITDILKTKNAETNYLLIPGLIDAHTHMFTEEQISKMLKNGITATCDVVGSQMLIHNSKQLNIISSSGMTMGTLNGKAYVKKAITLGAKYIKVLIMEPNFMLKNVLKDICKTAHENKIKVAAHAISIKAEQMCVDYGVDILIHVPLKEKISPELAIKIKKNKIAVIPTLVMMETFANSNRNGYKVEHFENAKYNVKLLYDNGVKILTGTDANDGSYAPFVDYGKTLHYEMELLTQCGIKEIEVLKATTSNVSSIFNIQNLGTISKNKPATLILIEGRPDKNITDIRNIKQIWIEGKPII